MAKVRPERIQTIIDAIVPELVYRTDIAINPPSAPPATHKNLFTTSDGLFPVLYDYDSKVTDDSDVAKKNVIFLKENQTYCLNATSPKLLKEVFLPITNQRTTSFSNKYYEIPQNEIDNINKLNNFNPRINTYDDKISLLLFSNNKVYSYDDLETHNQTVSSTNPLQTLSSDVIFESVEIENLAKDLFTTKVNFSCKIILSFKDLNSIEGKILEFKASDANNVSKRIQDMLFNSVTNEFFGLRISTLLNKEQYSTFGDYDIPFTQYQETIAGNITLTKQRYKLTKDYKLTYKNHELKLFDNKAVGAVAAPLPHKLIIEFVGIDTSASNSPSDNLYEGTVKDTISSSLRTIEENINTKITSLYSRSNDGIISANGDQDKINEIVEKTKEEYNKILQEASLDSQFITSLTKIYLIDDILKKMNIYRVPIKSSIFGTYEAGLNLDSIISAGSTALSVFPIVAPFAKTTPGAIAAGTAIVGAASYTFYQEINKGTEVSLSDRVLKGFIDSDSTNIGSVSKLKPSDTDYSQITDIKTEAENKKNEVVRGSTGVSSNTSADFLNRITKLFKDLMESINVTDSNVNVGDTQDGELTNMDFILFGDLINFISSKLKLDNNLIICGNYKIIRGGKEYYINLGNYPISLPLFIDFLNNTLDSNANLQYDAFLFLQKCVSDLLKTSIEKLVSVQQTENYFFGRHKRPYEIFITSNYINQNRDQIVTDLRSYGFVKTGNTSGIQLNLTDAETNLEVQSKYFFNKCQTYTGTSANRVKMIYIGSKNPADLLDIYSTWNAGLDVSDTQNSTAVYLKDNVGYNSYFFGEYLIDRFYIPSILLTNPVKDNLATALSALDINLTKISNPNLITANLLQNNALLLKLPFEGSLKMFGMYNMFLTIGNNLYISPSDSRNTSLGYTGVYTITKTKYTKGYTQQYITSNLGKSNFEISITHSTYADGTQRALNPAPPASANPLDFIRKLDNSPVR